MLTSRITKQIEHPDEPGVTFTLRKLSHHQLGMAVDAKRDEALRMMKSLEGIALPESTEEQKAATNPDGPENKYHRDTLLKYGITAWSYDAPCDDANKADLDEPTAAWLFDEIAGFSVRSVQEGEESASALPATTA